MKTEILSLVILMATACTTVYSQTLKLYRDDTGIRIWETEGSEGSWLNDRLRVDGENKSFTGKWFQRGRYGFIIIPHLNGYKHGDYISCRVEKLNNIADTTILTTGKYYNDKKVGVWVEYNRKVKKRHNVNRKI